MDFHEVYERYAASVQRFAYWLCQDEQMAQDLTSETFTRAWLRLDHLREPTLRAYLLRSHAISTWLTGGGTAVRLTCPRVCQPPTSRCTPSPRPPTIWPGCNWP